MILVLLVAFVACAAVEGVFMRPPYNYISTAMHQGSNDNSKRDMTSGCEEMLKDKSYADILAGVKTLRGHSAGNVLPPKALSCLKHLMAIVKQRESQRKN